MVFNLANVGMLPDIYGTFKQLIDRPHGIVLVTGPTGSGKSTTLYAALNAINSPEKNIITIEDPVEYQMDGINQIQVNLRAGLTFAQGLRSMLRADPDVIMVGEIRDTETAGIALQASLTGHLVLSTLHTSDAVESAVRLVDLGVEPWIVANALTGILAQRLVRLVCKNCQELVPLESDLVDGDEVIMAKGTKVVKPKGCQTCLRTGYKGRTGIFEVVMVDDDMRELIKNKASPREYKTLLKKRGIATLRRIGLSKVKEGLTTVEEVVRVTI